MPYFRVILHGDGICVPFDSETARTLEIGAPEGAKPVTGFYTTRFVHAADRGAAIAKAMNIVAALWSEPPFCHINRGSSPQLLAEVVEQIGLFAYLTGKPRHGHTFYNEPDEAGERAN